MRHLLLYILLLMHSLVVYGQYFSTGDDPHSMKLMQKNSDRYRIIYDIPMKGWAERLAEQMDSIVEQSTTIAGHRPPKIDVMLHSRAARNNGLVSWAPQRMELYTYGQSDGDCVPWMTHLIAHEYRHAVQTSTINQGFSKFLYILFGEQAIGAVLGVYVPLWMLEGDAVVSETALTEGGRGRMGDFEQEMRALAMSNNTPTYDQAYLGSYKRRIPTYYNMGYLITSYAKLKYNERVWDNALQKVGRQSFSFTPFNRSLRHDTGSRKVALYKEAMREWEKKWENQDKTIKTTEYKPLSTLQYDYEEYISAQYAGDKLIAYQETPEKTPAIVDINGKKIASTQIRPDKKIAASERLIVWCEYRMDPRWDNASENQLMACDSYGHHKRTLLKGGRYSSPSISPNGEKIAAIKTLDDGNQTIIIYDLSKNGVVAELPLEDLEQATSTTWTDDQTIAYISLTDKGKAIVATDLEGRERKTITDYRYENIRHLTSHKGAIYYTSDATGIDNIYTKKEGEEAYRITSAKYGAAWPCVNDTTLIYSDYSESGYKIVYTSLSTRASDEPISPMRDVANRLSEQAHKQMDGWKKQRQEKIKSEEPHRYRRIAHLFNIHSWGPIIVDANANTVRTGVSIASQNTLGTSLFSVGMNWGKDHEDRYFAKYTYTGLMPKIDLKASWGYYDYKMDDMLMTSDTTGIRYVYDDRQKNMKMSGRIYLPLGTNRGSFVMGVTPSLSLEKYKYSGITIGTQKMTMWKMKFPPIMVPMWSEIEYHKALEKKYSAVRYDLRTYIIKSLAERDLEYRLGISLQGGLMYTPIGNNMGNNRYAMATVYLPGFWRHHSIRVDLQYQKKNVGGNLKAIDGYEYAALLGDATDIARGTKRIRNDKLALFKANYTMPLFNPDWSIGPICYIKRVNARLFFDAERVKYRPYAKEDAKLYKYRTTGAEVWMESHWLRLPYKVNLGMRYSKIIGGGYRSDLLMSINVK